MEIIGISLSVIGLALLAVGWIMQLMHAWKNEKEIRKEFLGIYILGIIVLVVDGYTTGLTAIAALNAITGILSGLVLYKTMQ